MDFKIQEDHHNDKPKSDLCNNGGSSIHSSPSKHNLGGFPFDNKSFHSSNEPLFEKKASSYECRDNIYSNFMRIEHKSAKGPQIETNQDINGPSLKEIDLENDKGDQVSKKVDNS